MSLCRRVRMLDSAMVNSASKYSHAIYAPAQNSKQNHVMEF
jgi:hypothetical protein